MCYAFKEMSGETAYSMDIVSKTAYLIGVKEKNFGIGEEALNPHPFSEEIFKQMSENKDLRIIRNLCILRTNFIRNRHRICNEMNSLKTIFDMPFINQDAIKQLKNDNMDIYMPNTLSDKYIQRFNEEIRQRVSSIKTVYPDWVPFDYLKNIFIMPKGSSNTGISEASRNYNQDTTVYPYQMYINWPKKEPGNILKNDLVLMRDLYNTNGRTFIDDNLLKTVTQEAKEDVFKFLKRNETSEIIVDCENSDPYMLHGLCKSIIENDCMKYIKKIILIDDENTSSAWDCLKNVLPDVPIEHKVTSRVLENKSLVDVSLVTTLTKEVFKEGIKGFMLCSSDSDFYGMIEGLQDECSWLVMVQRGQTAGAFKEILKEKGIWYAYLDDYGTSTSSEIKTVALIKETRRYIAERIPQLNIKQMLSEIDKSAKTALSEAERIRFYDKYLAKMKLVIAQDGALSIELGA